jgi:hypothetical protein
VIAKYAKGLAPRRVRRAIPTTSNSLSRSASTHSTSTTVLFCTSSAVGRDSPPVPSGDCLLSLGDNVLAFREKECWTGPAKLLDRVGESVTTLFKGRRTTFPNTMVKAAFRSGGSAHAGDVDEAHDGVGHTFEDLSVSLYPREGEVVFYYVGRAVWRLFCGTCYASCTCLYVPVGFYLEDCVRCVVSLIPGRKE